MRHALAIGLATLTACSLFTSLDDFDEEKTDGPDASSDGASSSSSGGSSSGGSSSGGSSSSGSSGSDSTVPDPDTGASYPNLHPNGSMEFSCQGWYSYNSTLESSATAHGGSASCMVCATETLNDTATIDESGAVLDPVVGGVYVASAWVRVPDGKGTPMSGVKLVFTSMGPGGELEFQQTPFMSVDATWKKLSVQLTPTKPATKLRIWVGQRAEAGTCFLVDDVRVEKWQ